MLVVMIGVGLAEAAGLIGGADTQARRRRRRSSTLTFIIVLLGIISSIASDAGYLVLIPLGAAAFKSVGRHPLAGIAAAFAGVAAGFGVNFLITPLDGVLTEITNDAAGRRRRGSHIDIAANLYFGIGSTIFVAIVLTFITARLVESRLGTWDPADAGEGLQRPTDGRGRAEDEARGLRYALLGDAGRRSSAIALLTVIPGAPLRDPETGEIIGDSPFMDSLIVIIMLDLLRRGLRLRARRRDDQGQRRRDRHDHEVVGRPREPALPVPADRAVHRVLQLQQHRRGRRGQARRRARAREHRRGVAADRPDHRDDDRRPDHPGGDRQVGAARADLHPAVHPPGRRAADRARRLPRRRLAVQRDHAADGVLPADRRSSSSGTRRTRASAPSSR